MSNCIVCNSELYNEPLITYYNMPASAQNMPSKSEIETEKGITLNLYQCKGCGLIQFDCEPVSYYKDVIRAGGFTSTMINLRRKQYREFIEYFNLNGKKIVEVGTGRGEFLSVLTEFNVKAHGIEHSRELVDVGVRNGLIITAGFVGNEYEVIPNGPFDGFLSFNFLEHQPDPNGMLQGIFNNLTDEGVGLVTVPSLEYIIENDSFYELIHDHIAYYTKESLCFLMDKNGFLVEKCEMINRDTWSVLVKKKPKIYVNKLIDNYKKVKVQLNNYIDSFISQNEKVAVWGASHQGFTIISMMDIASKVNYIIDSAPFKQGKYSPGSHVEIVSPEYYFENPVNAIIIIAPGYTDEIVEVIHERYGTEIEIAILKSKSLEIL